MNNSHVSRTCLIEHVARAQASETAEVEREHEKFLVEFVGAGTPVFLTDFPRELKPFYMKPNSDERTVCSPPAIVCRV